MNVVVCLEHHFARSPDGCVWTQAAFPYRFWQRYLEVFDGVRVVARVRDVPSPPAGHSRADGPGVAVEAVPDYLGPWQYLSKMRAVRLAVGRALGPTDAVILRVPSQLANCLFPLVRDQGRPYGLEVVGDPWEVFAPGVCRHPLRPLLRRHFTRQLKRQCRGACAAAYVTQRALQDRYPLGGGAGTPPFSVGVSDAELSEDAFSKRPSLCGEAGSLIRLLMVGSLAQLYKGPDTAIAAVAVCRRHKLDARLTIVGDGKFRQELQRKAAELGLADHVVFCGQLPQGESVRAELDRSDLFLMPSRTEGLPRALLEAMARGLPCIGSAVGGIPELLAEEDLIPPGDPSALARKIREVAADLSRMQRMAWRNLEVAKKFREDLLRDRRVAFYRFVRQRTEVWLQRRIAA